MPQKSLQDEIVKEKVVLEEKSDVSHLDQNSINNDEKDKSGLSVLEND